MRENLLNEYNQYIEDLTFGANGNRNEDQLGFINFVLHPTFEEWKEMQFGKVLAKSNLHNAMETV